MKRVSNVKIFTNQLKSYRKNTYRCSLVVHHTHCWKSKQWLPMNLNGMWKKHWTRWIMAHRFWEICRQVLQELSGMSRMVWIWVKYIDSEGFSSRKRHLGYAGCAGGIAFRNPWLEWNRRSASCKGSAGLIIVWGNRGALKTTSGAITK